MLDQVTMDEMKDIIKDEVSNFLDRDDYIDILRICLRNCKKSITESATGSYIDLDQLSENTIKEIYNLVKNRAKYVSDEHISKEKMEVSS